MPKLFGLNLPDLPYSRILGTGLGAGASFIPGVGPLASLGIQAGLQGGASFLQSRDRNKAQEQFERDKAAFNKEVSRRGNVSNLFAALGVNAPTNTRDLALPQVSQKSSFGSDLLGGASQGFSTANALRQAQAAQKTQGLQDEALRLGNETKRLNLNTLQGEAAGEAFANAPVQERFNNAKQIAPGVFEGGDISAGRTFSSSARDLPTISQAPGFQSGFNLKALGLQQDNVDRQQKIEREALEQDILRQKFNKMNQAQDTGDVMPPKVFEEVIAPYTKEIRTTIDRELKAAELNPSKIGLILEDAVRFAKQRNGTGDNSLMKSVEKIIDPQSIISPTEFATVQKSADTLINRGLTFLRNQVNNETGELTDEARKSLVSHIAGIVEGKRSEINAIIKREIDFSTQQLPTNVQGFAKQSVIDRLRSDFKVLQIEDITDKLEQALEQFDQEAPNPLGDSLRGRTLQVPDVLPPQPQGGLQKTGSFLEDLARFGKGLNTQFTRFDSARRSQPNQGSRFGLQPRVYR